METIQVYKCLCDTQRLRILNLLSASPLCVCHLQEVLGETQVKTSKQLAYMKKLGVLVSERHGQWMVYRLPDEPHPLLTANLQCLQDCGTEMEIFRQDLATRATILKRIANQGAECPTLLDARTSSVPGITSAKTGTAPAEESDNQKSIIRNP